MSQVLFQGIIPPVPTVFDESGRLDEAGMARLIDHLAASEVDVLFFGGSAGEFSQMTSEQRRQVASFSVRHLAGRKKALVGIGSTSTDEAIRLGLHAQECGADGVVAVNPYYALLDERNLHDHYLRLARALEIPLVLYNFPALTNQDLSPSLVLRLAGECERIVGIKDTVDTLRHTRDLIRTLKPVRPDFAVLAGFDEYLLETLIMGGDGGFPSSSSFAPQLACGLLRAFRERDGKRMVELQALMARVPPVFGLEQPFYAVVKEAIRMAGVEISTHVLPPAAPLSEEKRAQVRELLRALGALPGSAPPR